MANDLLITAIRDAGLDVDEVAQIADADPRTVQRWLGGRVPHPRYRHKLAAALGVSAAELWPEATSVVRRSDAEEITGAWRRSDAPDVPDWRALLRGARGQVDLLGYSLSEILTARGIGKQLANKRADGCQIRVAIADPTDAPVIATDASQRPPGRLLPRVRDSNDRLRELVLETGIDGRQHHIATSHTILRFDDDLLLRVHVHGTPGLGAPLIHFHRRHDYGIFDQLAAHFEAVWAEARPIGARARRDKSATDPRDEQPERDPLDDLDYVWRPEQ